MLDFLVKFPDLLHSAIVFGTVIMFGALGEIITEKSGNLNLGVPGIMYFGGIAGLTSTFMYETSTAPMPASSRTRRCASSCASSRRSLPPRWAASSTAS